MSIHEVHASLDGTNLLNKFIVLMGQHIYKGVTKSDYIEV